MKIDRVETIAIGTPEWTPTDAWCTSALDGIALDDDGSHDRAIGLYNAPRDKRADPVTLVIVRVETSTGLEGLGCIGLGSRAAACVVNDLIAPLVVGHSPFDVERIWETLYRTTLNIGRKGMVLEAISAIDIALWDIIGKATGQPLYNLLGGATRNSIRAYCSSGYPVDDLDKYAELAADQMREGGYTAFKMRFGYGPRDGRPGMEKNLALVKALRQRLGDQIDLMGDAYMGWTPAYAVEMIRLIEPFALTWVEEPVSPDNLDSYAYIRERVATPIAGGEHAFTRWEFRNWLERGAVDYLQPDVNRVGGVTEARKIWALAQAFDVPVVPHSHNFHNTHLIMAHMNSPMAEHFPPGYRDGDTFLSELFEGEAELRDGRLHLNGLPGLGVRLKDETVARYRVELS